MKERLKIIGATCLLLVVTILAILLLGSCTGKEFNNIMEINLPKGEKVTTVMLEDYDIFYLTEPMDSNYIPKNKTFRNAGENCFIKTEVVFIEHK